MIIPDKIYYSNFLARKNSSFFTKRKRLRKILRENWLAELATDQYRHIVLKDATNRVVSSLFCNIFLILVILYVISQKWPCSKQLWNTYILKQNSPIQHPLYTDQRWHNSWLVTIIIFSIVWPPPNTAILNTFPSEWHNLSTPKRWSPNTVASIEYFRVHTRNTVNQEYLCEFIKQPVSRCNTIANNFRHCRNEGVRVCPINVEVEEVSQVTPFSMDDFPMHF